ncbi:MAG: hypothetical protein ACE5GK_05190 [Nitrospiria bacterium]
MSGTTALMFETLWFRQAGLAFGNSVWASSLVLSGFMGGLGLGNALAARTGRALKNPIRLYACLELAIGITGVLLVLFLPHFGRLLSPLILPILDRPWLINPLRLFLAFLFLLIPSTAMGLTLPILTKALSKVDSNFGRVLGSLYGWNTLGAFLGVVMTEHVFIGAFGLRATAWLAGILNAVVAAIAWKLSRQYPTLHPAIKTSDIPPSPPRRDGVQKTGRLFLTAAFISGFCLLALEIVWFRFLLLFVSGHSESFALMLAIVLVGIALGGLCASIGLGYRAGFADEIPATAFMMGVFSVVSYAAFPIFIEPYTGSVIHRTLDILGIGIPLMLPVSFLSGLLFTLIGSALKNHLHTETATTGLLTFANTMGAALGAFFAGFVLLPTIGMERSFFLISALYGVIGLIVIRTAPRISALAYSGVALFLLSILFFPSGAMEQRYLRMPNQRLIPPDSEGHIVGFREGRLETISYLETQWKGKSLSHRLVTNSYSMSSSDVRSRRYMKLFVYWPMAVHPDPKRALLISYGIGNTAKALTDDKTLEQIDVVDISQEILEMNDIVFPDPSAHPLRDPRVRVHIEDARYYLQTTDQYFDLITGEPPPPEMAGVVNLYTREYFQLLYDRLNEGGMVTYWLPLHSIDAKSVKAILRAFCEVFRDCSLWHGQWLDLMMIGTRHAQGPVSEAVFRRQWNDLIVAQELADIGIELPEQLGPLFIGDADYLQEIYRGTWPLVDDFPKRVRSSYGSRMALVRLIGRWINSGEAQRRFLNSALIRRLWPEPLRMGSLPFFPYQEILHRHWFGLRDPGNPAIADLHRVLTRSGLKTLPLWLLGSDADFDRVIRQAEETEDPLLQARLGMRQIADRDFQAAAQSMAKAEAGAKLAGDAFNYRIYALSMAGNKDEARQLVAKRMAEFLKDQPQGALAAPPLSPFWSWMKENHGIDPHSAARNQR